jgi:Icc-related predicted phosphoesterase
MKILAAADIHGNHQVYDWLVELALLRKPDALVLAGDLFGYPDGYDTIESAQEADREQVLSALGRLDVPVLYVMGNDDVVELRGASPLHRSLHAQRVELGGYNFVGYQYTMPFMGGVNERPERVIESDLLALESWIDDRTVLVTHVPAYGRLDFGLFGCRIGSQPLTELIARRQPMAHVHGHSHRGFGRRGQHFNVAAGEKKRAMLIDLETMEHEVLKEKEAAGTG